MDLAAAGLKEQPFRTHGKPLSIVTYSSHRDALTILRKTCAAPWGLALLQGPTLSGKSTVIRHFVESIESDCWVAVVDGKGLNTTSALLESVLRQFGYEPEYTSAGELLAMLRVFALQQAASHEPPILIVENTHALNPSALRALCELAELRVQQSSAFKMVLVSDRSLQSIIESQAMAPVAKRVTTDFHLHPMSSDEALLYIDQKLRAAGSEAPGFVFPNAVCTELWRASGGWPGILDRIALLALAKAETLPVSVTDIERPVLPHGTWELQPEADAELSDGAPVEPPMLYLTKDGETLGELLFDKDRLLIGRSEHNDLSLSSKYVSRHHLLLVRHGASTFMMDLNSTNGTFVNSRRVSNHVLIHDDVISLGHHRIKYIDPHARKRGSLEGSDFADTAIMKTLEDMRRLLAQENTDILPAQTEDLPTTTGN